MKASHFCSIVLLALAGSAAQATAKDEDDSDDKRSLTFDYDQDTYGLRDVGHALIAEYGTVVKVRDVKIIADKKETGGEKFHGIEYTIIAKSGKTYTIVENHNSSDTIFRVNAHVLFQTGGAYARVLPADSLPKEATRPEGIELKQKVDTDLPPVEKKKHKKHHEDDEEGAAADQ